MKKFNNFASILTLLLGLLATWLIFTSGKYWALPIGVLVVLVDAAVVVPGLWLPPLQRWWQGGRKGTAAVPTGSARTGVERIETRRTRRTTNLPPRGDVCEVIELTAYNPSSRSIVRFHQGAKHDDYTVSHNPDDTMQILGQKGWSIFYSGTNAETGQRYWVLNRANVPNRAIDDALSQLR